MKTSFYTHDELAEIGFKSYGEKVLISKKASIYSPSKIEIGDNVRIDDFCILSGKITIGSHIHIGAYSALYAGDFGIKIGDFSGLSPRCTVWAMTDDFSGNALLGPIVPEEFRNVYGGEVILEKYVSLATGVTVIARNTEGGGIKINEGCAVGAMSLVNKSLSEWTIYFGIPCRAFRERSRKIAELGEKFISSLEYK